MRKEIFALLTGIFFVSMAANLIKLLPDLTAFQIAFFRMAFSVIILSLFFVFFKKEFRKIDKNSLFLMTGSAFALTFHFITWISSLKYISVASSVSLVAMNPIFVALIRYFFFKKTSGFILYIGIALGVTGAVMISYSDVGTGVENLFSFHTLKGDIYALMGAFFASLYMISGQIVRKRTHIFVYIYLVYFITFLLLGIFLVLFDDTNISLRTKDIVLLFVMAMFSQVIGHSSFNFALKRISAETVALVILMEPVIASVIAYFLLCESVSGMQVPGMALVMTGIFLGMLSEKDAWS